MGVFTRNIHRANCGDSFRSGQSLCHNLHRERGFWANQDIQGHDEYLIDLDCVYMRVYVYIYNHIYIISS